jgi:hypothetical protein
VVRFLALAKQILACIETHVLGAARGELQKVRVESLEELVFGDDRFNGLHAIPRFCGARGPPP